MCAGMQALSDCLLCEEGPAGGQQLVVYLDFLDEPPRLPCRAMRYHSNDIHHLNDFYADNFLDEQLRLPRRVCLFL